MAVSPWAKIRDDAAAQPDQGPPPSAVPIWAPLGEQAEATPANAARNVFASVPRTTVTEASPLSRQIDRDSAKLQELQKPQKAWHDLSTGGKIGRVFADIGNVAGDIFAPGPTSLIPGTDLHKRMEESMLAGRLKNESTAESENQERGATTAKTQAETPQIAPDAASKRELEAAQAEKLRHPQEEWQPVTGWQGPKGEPMEYNKVSGAYRPAPGGTGSSLQKPPTNTEESKVASFIPPGGTKPMDFQWNPETKKYDIPLGEHYERPISVNAGDASVDRLAGRLAKPYQTGFDQAQGKFDRIQQTLHSVDAGYVGQGLAIPELLTALVSGQGTGVRITQPELNAITANRGLGNNAEGWFNSLVGKGKLTAEDKAQIKAVLNEARQRLEVKQSIASEALDSINGASSRAEIQHADKLARQRINEYEKHGFYTGQKIPQGTVVGFKDGKVQIDDAR